MVNTIPSILDLLNGVSKRDHFEVYFTQAELAMKAEYSILILSRAL